VHCGPGPLRGPRARQPGGPRGHRALSTGAQLARVHSRVARRGAHRPDAGGQPRIGLRWGVLHGALVMLEGDRVASYQLVSGRAPCASTTSCTPSRPACWCSRAIRRCSSNRRLPSRRGVPLS